MAKLDRVMKRKNRRPPVRRVSLPSGKRRSDVSARTLIYSFLFLILTGTVLLWLPVSTASGEFSSAIDAAFTATSAVCVTGLVVVNTAQHWSPFGQAIILILIQLGGFGIMTGVTLLLLGLRRRIGLQQRLIVGQSLGQSLIGGAASLLKRMALFVLFLEVIGAVIFFIRFSTNQSLARAAWMSIFHSISAFNNAGFDLFEGSTSMQAYQGDATIVLTTSVLIILGGISFVVLDDIYRKRKFSKLSLDSKVILVATAELLLTGWAITLLMEFNNPSTLGTLTLPGKLLASFFHSVTARTAGFTTLNVAAMMPFTLLFTMVLMFIGGVTGSTAGGIKVNTFGLLMVTLKSTLRGQQSVGAFRRTIDILQIRRALTIVLLSLLVLIIAIFLLSLTQKTELLSTLFEAVSAFGTVGLSTGITPVLSVAGKIIIMTTIFIGRLGPVTLASALIQRQRPGNYHDPGGTIRLG